MEAAVGSRLSNAPGRPEQLVVVLDCRGAPTLQARCPRFQSTPRPPKMYDNLAVQVAA